MNHRHRQKFSFPRLIHDTHSVFVDNKYIFWCTTPIQQWLIMSFKIKVIKYALWLLLLRNVCWHQLQILCRQLGKILYKQHCNQVPVGVESVSKLNVNKKVIKE